MTNPAIEAWHKRESARGFYSLAKRQPHLRVMHLRTAARLAGEAMDQMKLAAAYRKEP